MQGIRAVFVNFPALWDGCGSFLFAVMLKVGLTKETRTEVGSAAGNEENSATAELIPTPPQTTAAPDDNENEAPFWFICVPAPISRGSSFPAKT